MTMPLELEHEILRLHHAERWKVGTIATHLHVHHEAVRRVLTQHGVPPTAQGAKPSLADPYLPFIRETLAKYPKLTASRLFEMVKQRGYPGAPDHFRAVVARHRPRPAAEAYLRVRTLPGEQAQVDWAHFGKIRIGNVERRLLAFVMVLSHSRRIFLRFYLGDGGANFLRGHVAAFTAFGGVPRELLYDNLKSAVTERVGTAIRFNTTLLELASHYRFAPKPVAVARGNEKGRVERAIQYARHAFFAAREWKSLEDLNAQADAWCRGPASERKIAANDRQTVQEAFDYERTLLLPLPENPFETDERLAVKVGKTPYVRFDLNDYSVPHTHVQKILAVLASETRVRIVDGTTIIAEHARTYDRGRQIEDPAHIQALVDMKRQATKGRGMDRLHHAVPSSRLLLERLAERGGNLGGLTSGLLGLLDANGAEALERAVAEALAADVLHLAGVRQVLDRRARERSLPPPLAVALPNDPRVTEMVVRPHALANYDRIVEVSHEG